MLGGNDMMVQFRRRDTSKAGEGGIELDRLTQTPENLGIRQIVRSFRLTYYAPTTICLYEASGLNFQV